MTNNEKELIAALETDILAWESEVQFFENLVHDIAFLGRAPISGRDYARGLRQRIADHRALVQKVKKA
ncbi:MAG: hypothetical protein WAJ92_14660 [Candidatus Acidiferrales bacterium]